MKETNKTLEMINDNQVLENEIFNYKELDLERKNEVEDIIKVLAVLREVARTKRELFFIKGDNTSYYNEAWNIYESSFPDLFLDRMTSIEDKERKICSELFRLVGGCIKSKIIIPGKRSLYLQDILDTLEDATDLEFKGIRYSKKCKERNMSFDEYRYTLEFDKIQAEYKKEWTSRMNIIDDIIRTLGSYQEYAILNKDKEYKLEYTQEIKVDIA